MNLITERTLLDAQMPLLSFIEEYMSHLEAKNDIAEGTKRNYRKAVKHFKNYLKKESISHFLLTEFKYLQAQKFRLYLGSPEVNNTPVSASSIIRKLKTIFGEAIRQEKISKNPFNEIKLIYKSGNNTPYLTPDQLKSIPRNLRIIL
jgi:site-specific recombinase XerD